MTCCDFFFFKFLGSSAFLLHRSVYSNWAPSGHIPCGQTPWIQNEHTGSLYFMLAGAEQLVCRATAYSRVRSLPEEATFFEDTFFGTLFLSRKWGFWSALSSDNCISYVLALSPCPLLTYVLLNLFQTFPWTKVTPKLKLQGRKCPHAFVRLLRRLSSVNLQFFSLVQCSVAGLYKDAEFSQCCQGLRMQEYECLLWTYLNVSIYLILWPELFAL